MESVSSSPVSPLSTDDLRVLSQVRDKSRKVRRAASVAAISGWSLIAFGALGLPLALLGEWPALLLGIALVLLGINELRGGAMMRRLDSRGAARLGLNQVMVGAVIVAYSLWNLQSSLRQPPLASVGGSTGDPGVDALVKDLSATLSYGLYGGMAAIGIVAPGLTALYYFTRRSLIDKVIADSPAWAVEALRAAA